MLLTMWFQLNTDVVDVVDVDTVVVDCFSGDVLEWDWCFFCGLEDGIDGVDFEENSVAIDDSESNAFDDSEAALPPWHSISATSEPIKMAIK